MERAHFRRQAETRDAQLRRRNEAGANREGEGIPRPPPQQRLAKRKARGQEQGRSYLRRKPLDTILHGRTPTVRPWGI